MTANNQVAEASVKYLAEAAGQALPVGYKQTEVGVIPEDWEVVSLANVCKEIGDGIHATPVYSATGEYYFINGNNISNGKVVFDDSTKRVDEIEFSKLQKKLSSNTILLSINGTIGNLAYFNSEPLVLGKSAAYLDVKDNYSKEFVYYILQTTNTKKCFEDGLTGTTIKNLGLSTIRQTLVVAPQRPEQTAIANALSDVDALINGLEKLIAKKQAIKTATMQQLLTGRTRLPQFALSEDGTLKGFKQSELGEIPEDWEVASLGDIGQCVIGLTYSPNNVADFGTLVLRSSNVQGNRLAYEDNVYVQMDLPERVIVKKGDILVCVRNGSRQLIGKCALIDAKAEGSAFGAFMSVFRTQQYGFVFYQFQSDIIQNQINEIMGATINQITNKDMVGFKIPQPKLEEEQTAIATILSDMDTDIQTLQQRLSKTRQIKQGMMQELLTGKTRLI